MLELTVMLNVSSLEALCLLLTDCTAILASKTAQLLLGLSHVAF